MQGAKEDVEIDENLTYSLSTESFNKSLRLVNHSDHIYVFKIKTNQKTVISMQSTHDFIKPNSRKEISIKLADKPHETNPLKLQLNYTIPTDEDLRNNDSKMNSYPKDVIFKRIITIKRDDNAVEFKSSETKKQDKDSPKKGDVSEQINLSAVTFQVDPASPISFEKPPLSTPVNIRADIPKEYIKEDKIEYPVLLEPFAKKEEDPKPNVEVFKNQVPKEIKIEAPKEIKIEAIQEIQKNAPKQGLKEASKEKEVKVEEKRESKVQSLINDSRSMPILASSKLSSNEEKPFVNANSGNDFLQESKIKVSEIKIENPTLKTQAELRQLAEKIEKEKEIIKQLKSLLSNSGSNSAYPLPILISFLIAAFCLGAFINFICI